MAPPSFAQLVSLACHDLRTPLATASGFARTLERLDSLEQPADRYVEMIGAAADQLASLLDLLAVAARIESDRFEPQFREADARELADEAAARLDGAATVEGEGDTVRADAIWSAFALSALAEAARRHGGLEQITLTVDGASIAIAPIRDDAGVIAVGEELKDFAAAVGTRVLSATGAAVEPASDRVQVTFPRPT
ncbi:MAG TPA: histidine kinase dimerization/phospho-acceptor domain-containing protein [Gaiellaceae bacterium]|nr:histidine kinase dimerization/phospho-acceptor domain-containing protein [Gaiellaceae bacterium]